MPSVIKAFQCFSLILSPVDLRSLVSNSKDICCNRNLVLW